MQIATCITGVVGVVTKQRKLRCLNPHPLSLLLLVRLPEVLLFNTKFSSGLQNSQPD